MNKLDCHGMTDLILTENGDQCAFKKQILEADWKASLKEAAKHQSTALAASIANRISWPKLWDMALDHGSRGTDALQSLYRTLTRPNVGTKPCPLCDNQTAELSHFEHFITCHSPLVSSEFIVELLASGSTDIFVHAKHFL